MVKLTNIIRKGNKIYCDYYLDGGEEKYQLVIDIEKETCECNSEDTYSPHKAMRRLLKYIKSDKPLPKEDCFMWW
ncbi:MAG: hypothetical protein K5838_08875 [Elusimicrobiales bacterium]|nr:hypothetical protein [Elusimicrobiales bacterium]